MTAPAATAALARDRAGTDPPVDHADGADPTPENVGRRFFTWRTGASFLFGVAILAWVVRSSALDPADVIEKLRAIDLRWYALAVGSYLKIGRAHV